MGENDLNFFKNAENGVILTIKLTPNASKNEITGYTNEYVKIKVSAPPNEKKANKKLIEFISDYFNVSKSNIEFVSGDKSRTKRLFLKNISEEFIKQKIFLCGKIET